MQAILHYDMAVGRRPRLTLYRICVPTPTSYPGWHFGLTRILGPMEDEVLNNNIKQKSSLDHISKSYGEQEANLSQISHKAAFIKSAGAFPDHYSQTTALCAA